MKAIDTFAHILLFLAIITGAVAFWGLRYEKNMQLLVVITLIAFYILWGIVYHSTKRNINKKLFLEYLMIGAICSVVGVLVFYL